MKKRPLDLFLITLSAVCILLMIKTSGDPMISALRGGAFSAYLGRFTTGNEITFNLCVGIFASILMFFLVVRLPEFWQRRRLRKNLERTYNSFKTESIQLFLGCIQTSYSMDQVKELSDQVRFREFFKEPFKAAQTKWDGVANNLDDDKIKTLVVEFEILMNEIQYTLGAIDLTDEETFAFFKRISQVIYRSKNWTADYDDVKSILGLMWSLHTGWSWIDGYTGKDIMANMIANI
jgi:hypothetical protein